MKLVVVLLLLLMILTSSFGASESSISTTTTIRGAPFVRRWRDGYRGGATTSTSLNDSASASSSSEGYIAVAVIPSDVLDVAAIQSLPDALQPALRRQDDDDDDDSCCVLILEEPNDEGSTTSSLVSSPLPKNQDMVEALSMICHVVVLFVSHSELTLNPEVVQSILDGARRRRRLAGQDKLQLIVVLTGTTEATIAHAREELVLNELQDVDPQDFDSLEVVTVEELATVWNERTVADKDEVASELIDQDGLARLIETVYESLSKQTCKVELKSVVPKERSQSKLMHRQESDSADIVQQIMARAQTQLDALESKQADVWLNEDAVPMLEFGDEANEILEQATTALDAVEPAIPDDLRRQVLLSLATKLKILYDQQLQSLREHYGRRYEAVLDDSERTQDEWTLEAQQVTDAFRAAATHAIPKQCQQGQELIDADFSYVMELQGLLADMMEATSSREELNAIAQDDEEEEEGLVKQRVPKWCKKLAARAAVLGINYLQGWLAWQALQRAAVERDKSMPKFPLF